MDRSGQVWAGVGRSWTVVNKWTGVDKSWQQLTGVNRREWTGVDRSGQEWIRLDRREWTGVDSSGQEREDRSGTKVDRT